MDFSVKELECLEINGIVGANQMSKLFWQIDYSNKKALVTRNINNFDIADFETHIHFKPRPQKTPIIRTSVSGKNRLFN